MRERAPEASREAHMYTHREGPPIGPWACGSCSHSGWSNEAVVAMVFLLSQSRPGVNRLVTLLGIDKSSTFRAFDKTIIFGHWLSENINWHWPPGLSFWKGLLLYPSRPFSKEQKKYIYIYIYPFFKKILFPKKSFSSHGRLWGISTWGFTAFLTCFTTFLHMQT